MFGLGVDRTGRSMQRMSDGAKIPVSGS